jgi:ubiquinone/menaquinone biosynthesis C-methylase UbiE
MTNSVRSWAVDHPIESPFACPSGLTGRLAGRFMALKGHQQEVADLLDVRPGDRVVEIGSGPGVLLRLLAEDTGAALVCGVDPSPEMRTQAARRLRRVAAERVDLRIGDAATTGLPAAEFDRVVSVNNVALWPDLCEGIRETHRILRPGGALVIAWHSRTGRSRLARTLGLPEAKLDRISDVMTEFFGAVTRVELTDLVAFRAARTA